MRVAHFVQRYPPALGGSEAYFQRLSRYLAAQGDTVTVFTTAALDLEAFWSADGRCLPAGATRENGVTVHRYALWRWPGRRYLLKLLSLIPYPPWQGLALPCNPISGRMWADANRARQAFDIVHATAFPYAWPIACAVRLARRRRVPFLLTPFLHLGDPDDPNDRTRRAYTSPALLHLVRAADRIFVQTEMEQTALLSRGIPEGKVVRLGMGVDPIECTGGDRAAARHAWGAADEPVVGHLANNSEEKGSVDLLRAAAQAWHEGHRFRLVLAGQEMPNFRRFWHHYPCKERVHRLGILDARQKRDFFAGLDVFALPSRSDSFGLVLLEAWANGVPCVAYRAGGVAEVIHHEEDGVLLRCGDVPGLTAALGRLCADGDWRRRLGTQGQGRLWSEFRWEDKLERVRRVYQGAMSAIGGAEVPGDEAPAVGSAPPAATRRRVY
jgi:glycosyltransferase involved in cell wall biosynthesis